MTSVLFLGLLFGLRHAFDADHLAAVATLSVRAPTRAQVVRIGLAWGLGHGVTLFAAGTLVLLAGVGISERLALVLEAVVGVMLIGLGTDVIRTAITRRIHIHRHRHGGEAAHIHVHAHAHDQGQDQGRRHDALAHGHLHAAAAGRRALLVGAVHGLAGSAALVLLALGKAQTLAMGLGFLAVFGLGATAAMAAMSLSVVWPLRSCADSRPRLLNGVQMAAGGVSVVLGGWVLFESAVLTGLVG